MNFQTYDHSNFCGPCVQRLKNCLTYGIHIVGWKAFAINCIMEQVKPSYYVFFIKLKEIVNDVVPIHDVASKNKDAIDSQYFIFLNLKNINI
jgi:hypothetical protein